MSILGEKETQDWKTTFRS